MTQQSDSKTGNSENSKEIKVDFAKKKSKFIFFSDRELKLYENGCFAYYGARSKELKTMIQPSELVQITLEGKDKMKISTKNKKYLFKFGTSEKAQDWIQTLTKVATLHGANLK